MAIRLLMLTGCRLWEIQKLRWEHVDLEAGELLLPDSKTGGRGGGRWRLRRYGYWSPCPAARTTRG